MEDKLHFFLLYFRVKTYFINNTPNEKANYLIEMSVWNRSTTTAGMDNACGLCYSCVVLTTSHGETKTTPLQTVSRRKSLNC